MPHRVEHAARSRGPYDRPAPPASPPPIATLHSGSPTPSLDRSSVSTPPVPAHHQQPSSSHYGPGRRYDEQPSHYQHQLPAMQGYPPPPRGYTYPPPHPQGGFPPPPPPHMNAYSYPPPHLPPPPHHYAHHMAPPPPMVSSSIPALSSPLNPGSSPQVGNNNYNIIYTEDASTKLSDRVRRRCFNCCTTDTSTWRRSNLSPGKVLCNKCGLFERTHSRPRPDQFPHKRGGVGVVGSPNMSGSAPPGSVGMQPPPMMHPQTHTPPPPSHHSPSPLMRHSQSPPTSSSGLPSKANGSNSASGSPRAAHSSPHMNGHSLPPTPVPAPHPLSNSHMAEDHGHTRTPPRRTPSPLAGLSGPAVSVGGPDGDRGDD